MLQQLKEKIQKAVPKYNEIKCPDILKSLEFTLEDVFLAMGDNQDYEWGISEGYFEFFEDGEVVFSWKCGFSLDEQSPELWEFLNGII